MRSHSRVVTAPYVPLRVFSSFTMLEGAMEPKTIADRASKLGFPAIALTDRNGLYAAMRARAAKSPYAGTAASPRSTGKWRASSTAPGCCPISVV